MTVEFNPWKNIEPKILDKYKEYAKKNQIPAYLNGFAGRYLFGPPTEVNGMLRAIQCTPSEFWEIAEQFCVEAGGGSHDMEKLLYELMLAGRTLITRTVSEKRKGEEKILGSIRRLLNDLNGDPLARELTVPVLAKTRATEALNELQTSLDYKEPPTQQYFDDHDRVIDDIEQAIADGINFTCEEQSSERESFIVGLICGPRLADLLQGAVAAYENEQQGNSVLGPFREHTATELHPKELTDRRIYFYTRIISWFSKLSPEPRLEKELISNTLDAILSDENPDLVDSGDAWKNALRKVRNAQEKNKL